MSYSSSGTWDEVRLVQLVKDQEPENVGLEYKSAQVFDNGDHRTLITKSVSAMANSDGGILIYGIGTVNDKNGKKVPKSFEPIDPASKYTVEWLGQKIDLVRPAVARDIIPIELKTTQPGMLVYVVVIQKGTTAHQAYDKIYYKRYDSRSLPMEDYDVRDVMGRRQNPKIALRFAVHIGREQVGNSKLFSPMSLTLEKKPPEFRDTYTLNIWATNTGDVYAHYITAHIDIPLCLYPPYHKYAGGSDSSLIDPRNLAGHGTLKLSNLVRDRVGVGGMYADHSTGVGCYEPILPGMTHHLGSFRMGPQFAELDLSELSILWRTHTDSAPVNTGEVLISDITVRDNREEE